MSRALVYSRKALADLNEIFDFIAADNARRARDLYPRDRNRLQRALHHAHDGDGAAGHSPWSARYAFVEEDRRRLQVAFT